MNHIYSILFMYFIIIIISPSISHSSKENCQPSHQPQWVLTPLHDKQNNYKEKLSSYKDDEIKSSLTLSARLVLNGIKVYDQWTDCKEKQHWVMVSINRSIADKQVKAQGFINQVLKCLKSGQKETSAFG
ncbi:hypothetical protein MHK_008897 [Candidatus Magnetomorum sp. HK-1]|nr:hypothetical protein MHK_008897 [Candidatus Magnetomorum sp. HK-1]